MMWCRTEGFVYSGSGCSTSGNVCRSGKRNPNGVPLPSFLWGFWASNVHLAVDNLFFQPVEVLFLIVGNLNVTIQRIRTSTIYFRTSRTNSNRTDHCSVRVHLEQNSSEPSLVRFCSF